MNDTRIVYCKDGSYELTGRFVVKVIEKEGVKYYRVKDLLRICNIHDASMWLSKLRREKGDIIKLEKMSAYIWGDGGRKAYSNFANSEEVEKLIPLLPLSPDDKKWIIENILGHGSSVKTKIQTENNIEDTIDEMLVNLIRIRKMLIKH